MANQIKCYLCKIHKNLKVKYTYLLLLFCLISLRFQQPSSFDTNSKIKAAFIYGFTRYFEWPEQKKAANFVIYVVGNKGESIIGELKGLAGKKKVGNQDIEIKQSPGYDASTNSSIIYFTSDCESKMISDAVSKNKGKGTLVISEIPQGCKSPAAINFIYLDNKLKFEYNKNNAVRSGLQTKEDFKALAAVNCD